MHVRVSILVSTIIVVGGLRPVAAQTPPATQPSSGWHGKIGGGLAVTSGNADTKNVNLGFDATRDAGTGHVFKADGLYLRGSNDGTTHLNRTTLSMRNEVSRGERTFVFAQVGYLRDTFKAIDYLVFPTAGVGHIVHASDTVSFSVDGGLGVVWEKNAGTDVRTSGAVTAGQDAEWKLSESATLEQSLKALWKMNDFGDTLCTFGVGLTTAITARTTLSVELLNTFKSRPPSVGIRKNDVAIVTAFAFTY